MLYCRHHATPWDTKRSQQMDAQHLLGNNSLWCTNLRNSRSLRRRIWQVINLSFLYLSAFTIRSSPPSTQKLPATSAAVQTFVAFRRPSPLFWGHRAVDEEQCLFLKGVGSESRCGGVRLTSCGIEHWPPWQVALWSLINGFWGVPDIKSPIKLWSPSSHF